MKEKVLFVYSPETESSSYAKDAVDWSYFQETWLGLLVVTRLTRYLLSCVLTLQGLLYYFPSIWFGQILTT